ncbi:hypothetical protein AXF42_Ash013974 [Apostasia shenzhenica]|uniref:Uncharacterized protein n=1 Tax=Apostasia shenzhenica TaxID=1088818 RepID=A0A2I0ASE0_9ASPA|nr:hypothetical protein AXF42_Ash013974 [Apostasia shenzhenica]
MPMFGSVRRLSTIFRRVPTLLGSEITLFGDLLETTREAPFTFVQGSWARSFSSSPFGNNTKAALVMLASQQWRSSSMVIVHFSTQANEGNDASLETVEELYKKMLNSVEAKTMPPNAWLWSLIGKCTNEEDIMLLFKILKRLRVFRLSSLRIHANFNCHLCLKVTEACVRSDALHYGMKVLCKHNMYGLTPTIASAHCLLVHAKKNNDVKLVEKIMKLLRGNSLPLQPGTADIVFRVCFDTNNWRLLLKYAKLFLKAGVKLHRPAFDNLMEFAANMGDTESIWKTEQHRAKHLKNHTFATGFACAKAFIIEGKPESAAAIISRLYKELPDSKKPQIADELQKLVNQWPPELLKRKKKEEERKALGENLRSNIPAVAAALLSLGVNASINLEELKFSHC